MSSNSIASVSSTCFVWKKSSLCHTSRVPSEGLKSVTHCRTYQSCLQLDLYIIILILVFHTNFMLIVEENNGFLIRGVGQPY